MPKYGIDILIMILICRISNADKKHFMYAPVTKVNSKTEKVQNRDEFLKKRLLLIPEFVKIHPLPGSLWREIQMFGFIITRLTQFMNLDVFMNELSKAGPFYSSRQDDEEELCDGGAWPVAG